VPGILAALATGAVPATVMALHFRRWHRDSGAVADALRKAEMERGHILKEQPKHWLQAFSPVTFLALPFAQWVAYTSYQTSVAFFLPLAVATAIFVIVGVCRPPAVFLRPPNHREWAIYCGLLAVGLGVALVMPPSGAALLLRGVLIDVLVLLVVAYSLRLYQDRGSKLA
jgi:hypothetical protein